ncbi:MAG TPA: hypothetical protein VHV30_16935 [Polyangiaceae bacterium]|nr:hypothetical protein [Polyangiaceae bacterium]
MDRAPSITAPEPSARPAAPRPDRGRARALTLAKKWAFAVVPAIGVLELGAQLVQARRHIDGGDWKRARDFVAGAAHPDDLVTFAPRWVDVIGREEFGPQVATLEREARPDETRFARAFEVSMHGGHDARLEGWKRIEDHDFGQVHVTTLENPSPAHVLDDLVSLVSPDRLQVQRVDGDKVVDCPFTHAGVQSGGLGAGPAVPGDRFVCPTGGFVGASVAADLDYYPRRCIYAPPQGNRSVLRLRFENVQIGRTLHGHHGLYVEAERNKTGQPVTITFRIHDAVVGAVVHHDGDGWKPFEFDTSAQLEGGAQEGANGARADVVVDISSPSGDRRMYCFEADTR